MDRKTLISEIKSSYPWRRAENWLITVTIILMILTLAAGIDYTLDPGATPITELLVWGGALLWILVFSLVHTKTMGRLLKNEKHVIAGLMNGKEYKYRESKENPARRWIVAIVALIIAGFLITISISIILGAKEFGNFPLELTAELTIIIFASILAIIAAMVCIFPIRQVVYSIKVTTLGRDPAILVYKIRRRA